MEKFNGILSLDIESENLYEKIKDPNYVPSKKQLENFFFGANNQNKSYEKLSKFCTKDKNDNIFEFVTEELLEGLTEHVMETIEKFKKNKNETILILEIGAGRGKLGYNLQKHCNNKLPDKIKIIVTDRGDFNRDYLDIVEKIDSKNAINKYRPDIVIQSWMIGDIDLTQNWRDCQNVKEYILIGTEKYCGKSDLTWGVEPKHQDKKIKFVKPYEKDGFERIDLDDIETFSQTMESKVVSFKR